MGEWITWGNESLLHLGQRLPASSSRRSSDRIADRAALIGRLTVRDDATWLAELLMDLEDEVGEIARLRLIDALRRELGSTMLETVVPSNEASNERGNIGDEDDVPDGTSSRRTSTGPDEPEHDGSHGAG